MNVMNLRSYSGVACLASMLSAGPVVVAQSSGSQALGLAQLSRTLEELSERVGPAIVQIYTTGYTAAQGRAAGPESLLQTQRGRSSGVILDPDGYIVTNAHVVLNATRVEVELAVPSGATAERRSILKPSGGLVGAQVVGIDTETDLAVLKVQVERELPFLTLGDSDQLRTGQIVMAFGSPLGLGDSVTLGVVSAVARQLRPDDPMIYVQTDAAINPGNSGGALVDVQGRVVGISTFILSQSGGSEGLGFAAPSNIIRAVYEQIRADGRVRRGEIGVRAQTITPELAHGLALPQDWGVVLGDVFPGGPADNAGLNVGDIVLTLEGKSMENGRQFQVNLYRRAVRDPVELEVLRGSARLTFSIVPVERPGDPDRFRTMVRPDEHLVSPFGILGRSLDSDVAALLPPLRRQTGVVVAASTGGVVLGGGGLLPGDVIYAINQQPIGNLSQLRGVLSKFRRGDPVVLQIERLGQLTFLTLRLE